MTRHRHIVLLLMAAFVFALGATAHAEDWTTTDGKIYRDVRVVKLEDDAVTILHRDGGALIPLANLPSALQARFNYDPAKARSAIAARAQGDQDSAAALAAERIEAAKLKAAQDAKYKADKKAIDDAKAAAAAAEPPDDPFHASQFELNRTDDTRRHIPTSEDLPTNDPETPVAPGPAGH